MFKNKVQPGDILRDINKEVFKEEIDALKRQRKGIEHRRFEQQEDFFRQIEVLERQRWGGLQKREGTERQARARGNPGRAQEAGERANPVDRGQQAEGAGQARAGKEGFEDARARSAAGSRGPLAEAERWA